MDPAKRWTFDRKWKPEGAEQSDEEDDARFRGPSPSSFYRNLRAEGDRSSWSEKRADQGATDRSRGTERPSLKHLSPHPSPLSSRSMRSVTAPPRMTPRVAIRPNVPAVAGRINRINEAVRSQAESAQHTRVRRRQQAEARTPDLPPTPESMQGKFTADTIVIDEHDERSESQSEADKEEDADAEDEEEDDDEEEEAEEHDEEEKAEEGEHTTFDDNVQSPEEIAGWAVHEVEQDLENQISSLSMSDVTKNEAKLDDPIPETHKTHSIVNDSRQAKETPTEAAITIVEPSAPQTSEHPANAARPSHAKATDTTRRLPEMRAAAHSRAISSDYAQDMAPTSSTSPNPSTTSTSPTPSSSSFSTSSSYHSLPSVPTRDSLTYRVPVPPAAPLSLTQHYQQNSTAVALAGTGALLVKRTVQIFLGPPAHLVALMLKIAARIVAGGGGDDEGLSLTVPAPGSENAGSERARGKRASTGINTATSTAISSGVDALGMTGVRELRARESILVARAPHLGHRRIPGSFDFSDDEEEWGGM